MDKPNNHEPEAGSNARHTHQTSTELGIFLVSFAPCNKRTKITKRQGGEKG